MFPPAAPLAQPPDPNAQAPIGTNTPAAPDEAARLEKRKALCTVPMSADECADLWKSVNRAKERVKKQSETWKILFKEYLPVVKESGTPEALKVNAHFYNVQTKIGQLFPRSPRIACLAKGPSLDAVLQPGTMVPQTAQDAGAVEIKQAVLNDYLGPERINGSRLMHQCLFDVLAWAGFGAMKIGYKATMVTVQQPVMQADPKVQPQPGTVLGLNAQPPMVQARDPQTGEPLTRSVQVPIFEDIYANHFSPLKALWNDDLSSSDFDKDATWMGWQFAIPKETAQREFALSDDELTHLGSDENVFEHKDREGVNKPTNLVRGVELWRKASLVRPDTQPHPLALDHIVLIEGMQERPAVCRPSPDQEFDPQGRLTPDSMIGFPIHIVTNRVLGDSPFVPADSAFTNCEVKELNTYDRQTLEIRDAQVPLRLLDASHFEDTDIDTLKNAAVRDKILIVKPGALASGGKDSIISTAEQPTQTADTWRGRQVIERSMQKTLGISDQQLSTPTDTVRSATEIAQDATAYAGRMGTEQDFVVACFVAAARKIDALIMRYGPKSPEFVAIVGQDGAKTYAAWNRQLVAGRYAYDIMADSTWRLDVGQQLRLKLSGYNLFKGDPLFNRAPYMRDLVQLMGSDPSKCVMTPEQIAQQATLMQAQPPHGEHAPNPQEQNRTGATPNGPESVGGSSRVMGG